MVIPRRSLWCCLLLWLVSVLSLAATAQPVDSDSLVSTSPNHDSDVVGASSPRATSAVALRILTLGASIMQGYLSTDGNGMRWGFRSALVNAGHAVNMIGSVKAGTMGDNDTETWSGYRIDQVTTKAELSIPQQPNVALILCGSNDISQNFDTANMAKRMGVLIDRLFAAIPGVVVIVSTLPPRGDAATDATTIVFNANLTVLIRNYQRVGKLVGIVDAHSQWFTTADLQDGEHPTDAGYLKLARVFYDGLTGMMGNVTPPIVTGSSDTSPPDPKGTTAPNLPVNPYNHPLG